MTTYYVSPTGSDSNNGTSSSTPWLTLTKVKNKLVAGDTAIFAPGTYTGKVTFNTSGTSGNPITLLSSVKWGAKIVQGTGSGLGTTLLHTQADYITFDGFEITAPDYQLGVFIESNYVTVQNCWVHDVCNSFNPHSNGGYGIGNWQTNYHSLGGVVIQNNRVERVGLKDINGNITYQQYVHTIYVQCDNSVSQSTIQNNLIIQSSGMGISLYHNPNNWLVTNNTIIKAYTYGLDCWGDYGSGYIADHNTIQNNIFRDCGPNSAYASQSSACGTHNVFRKNIAYGTYVRTYDYTSYDFIPGTGNPLQTDTNLTNANPLFVNYQTDGSGNYHLSAGSPCLDTATSTNAPSTDFDGNARPQGAGYDIGAYELSVFASLGNAENQNTGTSAWVINSQASTTQIQAYCDKVAYDPGQTVTFYVSTQVNTTTWTLTIYRMGYYQGTGGCLKFTSATQTGVAQGYWDESGQTLNNCPTAIIDGTTHKVEAGWASSYTWVIPSTAYTGVYLAQFTDANGWRTNTTFVVRGNSPADYCYVRPVTTDQAYNDWGGYSLYSATQATKVSFNRPIVQGRGTHGVILFEMNFIKWAESQGYNLSYLTSVDIHANNALLLNYRAFLSPGHDEYWSREMRDGVEAALAAGVGLAFLGANACYWQIRFENDAGGNANRTITCYKVGASPMTLYNDPQFGVDNTRVTTQWRQFPVNRPENQLIGIMYSSLLTSAGNGVSNVAWKTDAAATSCTYVGGTGLTNSTTYGYDLVGYEYDKQFPNGPSNLQIIGTTSVTDTNSMWLHRVQSSLPQAQRTGQLAWIRIAMWCKGEVHQR